MSKEYVKKNMGKGLYDACKSLHTGLMRQWGTSGWMSLGETFQQALIAERVLHVFSGRDDNFNISPSMISKYLEAMWRYCDILKDDE